MRSILGQFLEHSRIINFRALDQTFIGSADMMHRNLDRRAEVMAQVKDPRLTAYLEEVFDSAMDPSTRCWELGPEGHWTASPHADRQVRGPSGLADGQSSAALSARYRARAALCGHPIDLWELRWPRGRHGTARRPNRRRRKQRKHKPAQQVIAGGRGAVAAGPGLRSTAGRGDSPSALRRLVATEGQVGRRRERTGWPRCARSGRNRPAVASGPTADRGELPDSPRASRSSTTGPRAVSVEISPRVRRSTGWCGCRSPKRLGC